jgi:integrase
VRGKDRLSARFVATAPPGEHHDGGGLYLVVSPTGARSWLYRFHFDGKRRFMGLGPLEDVPLTKARDLRDDARRLRNSGRNPIDERRAARKAQAGRKTFGDVALELLAAKAPEWGNAKHAEQWRVSLTNAAAALTPLPVESIDTETVLGVLKPIWLEKPESASRLRQRIEAVLAYASAHGMRSGENPARWRGHLEHLLAKPDRGLRGHHAALGYAAVPAFVTRLRAIETVSARALEFVILTAGRSGEVYGATWAEIDADGKLWTVPASRMKAGREHRVPLAPRALEIVETMKAMRVSDYLFPGRARGKPLSHVAMAKTIERIGVENATVHGFRSAFRDWCGDHTEFPREVAEAALAHMVGDKAEQAYRRGDALAKRRALMDAWAAFVDSTGRADA